MDVPFYFAFSAGAIAAFNPCGIAMFPAYVGYSFGNFRASGNPLLAIWRGLYLGLSLSLGFLVVFGFAGILLAFGGRFIGSLLPLLGFSIGLIITIVGIFLILYKQNISLNLFSDLRLGNLDGTFQTFLFGL